MTGCVPRTEDFLWPQHKPGAQEGQGLASSHTCPTLALSSGFGKRSDSETHSPAWTLPPAEFPAHCLPGDGGGEREILGRCLASTSAPSAYLRPCHLATANCLLINEAI